VCVCVCARARARAIERESATDRKKIWLVLSRIFVNEHQASFMNNETKTRP
jgi:hypothetical protein